MYRQIEVDYSPELKNFQHRGFNIRVLLDGQHLCDDGIPDRVGAVPGRWHEVVEASANLVQASRGLENFILQKAQP